MLEQIHADAEDQRKTKVIVGSSLVTYAVYALFTAATGGLAGLAMVGIAAGSTGLSILATTRTQPTYTVKRFAH
ncbi:MAG: hypothetical protein JO306_15575 [Gemmatimonadetes bacterium]|nr:hypothetical protein [Gemmatimonadota bacterium]